MISLLSKSNINLIDSNLCIDQ